MNLVKFKDAVNSADKILIIQGENLDADSLSSSLALDSMLAKKDKEIYMYCHVEIPTYLKYIEGWDRITNEFPGSIDLIIILDTNSSDLLKKTQGVPEARQLHTKPVFVIDHHSGEGTFSFDTEEVIDEDASSTSIVLYKIAKELKWDLDKTIAQYFTQSIMADTQGLSNSSTNLEALEVIVELVKQGVDLSELENSRRQLMKKSKEILEYKGRLIDRIDYHLDGALATIHIPWEEIEEYSHAYNPSMLVMDEMRMVQGVKLAIAYKTYPDGKILGKIRCNNDALIGDKLARDFGGGGHPGASGFKLFDKDFEELNVEVIKRTAELLDEAL